MMKFILKIIKTLFTLSLLIAMAVTAFWFLNDQNTREEWYNKTVAQVTGKTFDESFDYKHDHSSETGSNGYGW